MIKNVNYQSLAEQFWQQGYLVMEDFFSPTLMEEMHQAILDYYGEDPEFFHNEEFLKKSYTEVIPWFPQRDGEELFDQVDKDLRFHDLTSAILGAGWQAQYSMVMFSKKQSKGQAWHQDCPPDVPDQFNLNRLIYTEDISEQTGGQVVIRPFTHRTGELSVGHPDEDFSDQIELSPKKGTLVLLHGHCWHKIRPVGKRFRISTNYRAAPMGVAEDITDVCVYRNMRYQFSTQKVLVDRTLPATT